MREIAARYPVTYRRVGEKIEALGFDLSVEPTPKEICRMMTAILAAMPPHVVPYGSMGDDRAWSEIDWADFIDDLYTDTWLPQALEADRAWRVKRGLIDR